MGYWRGNRAAGLVDKLEGLQLEGLLPALLGLGVRDRGLLHITVKWPTR